MTMLVDERGTEPAATPPEEVTPVRSCPTCGAEMATDQDWCLSCGTAAPGRLGSRPGMRAASTIVALVLLLTGGAVAASYAALSDDASREAGKPAGPSGAPVAQVPPAATTTAPGSPTVPTVPGATTPTTPAPSVPQPGTTPTVPKPTTTAPTIKLPNASPQPQGNTSPSPGTTTIPQSSGGTNSGKTTTQQPADTGPSPLDLPADSVALYDPYARATEKTDPADAYDNDTKSAYSVTAKDGTKMGLGIVVDLESKKAVREIELATSTPGFRAEIYATDSSELPPDILDTRWAHIRDRSRVDETSTGGNKAGDGEERIVLGGGSVKYRYYVIWITTPPDAGPTVRLQDLKLLG
jgi:hypothetical protein